MNRFDHPKLRPLDIQPALQGGRRVLYLRDPLQLANKAVLVPEELAPILGLCDGTRDLGALRASLAVRYGLPLSEGLMTQVLGAMDEALLFDNDRYAQALEDAREAYRRATFRTPALAGASYPAEPEALSQLLQGLLDLVDETPATEGRGLISPHIDYARGGPVYARIWKRAAEIARAAELVVILGTDHYGSEGALTLTRQHYATPWGVLPTAQGIVDDLAEALGQGAAFAEELHHRSEHSIELAAVWLHYLRQGQPCETVPILCGSFAPFVRGQVEPTNDLAIAALVRTLRDAAGRRRMLVVAAGDLSHVGPAFGGAPLDLASSAQLQADDDALLAHVIQGDAKGFMDAIRQVHDRNNVCGVSPIYLLLRVLGASRGELVAYDRCPADERGASAVSICGMLLQ